MGISEFLVQGALAALLSVTGPQTSSPNLRPVQDVFEQGHGMAPRRSHHQGLRLASALDHDGYATDDSTDDGTAALSVPADLETYRTGDAVRVDSSVLYKELSWLVTQPASPIESPQVQAVAWIQGVTGLSDERTAGLLGVSRQALLGWKAGGAIKDENLRRLLETRDVLQRAERRYPSRDLLRGWLYAPDDIEGVSPASLLRQGELNRARYLAVVGPTTVSSPAASSKRITSSAWKAVIERPERVGEFDDLG